MEINEIIENVALALRTEYPDIPVRVDDVAQGLEPPGFHILTLPASIERFPSERYLRRLPLDILYYPASDGSNTEMLGIADKLFLLLEFITSSRSGYQNVLHGTGMRHEITDGVLHFFVSYDTMLRREKHSAFMQSLSGHVTTVSPSGTGGSGAYGSGGTPAGSTGIATGGTDYMQTIDINTNT